MSTIEKIRKHFSQVTGLVIMSYFLITLLITGFFLAIGSSLFSTEIDERKYEEIKKFVSEGKLTKQEIQPFLDDNKISKHEFRIIIGRVLDKEEEEERTNVEIIKNELRTKEKQ